jgi:phosphotransferase system  glucose/maltose/N-acetylglucosamine-specific IIC component
MLNSSPSDEIDMSLFSWVTNTHSVLHWPLTVLSVAGLVILGSFIEIAPRKSLEFLDNILGRSLFFILPFLIAMLTDWSTGLLAAVVSLIIFARLQKQESSEGFTDTSDGTDNSTKIISNSHRWFIERVLGESPVAISSDRVTTSASKGSDIRSSSSTLSTESNPVDRSSSSSYK